MFGNRLVANFKLSTVTSTHIGTGHDEQLPSLNGENETTRFATIVRDHEGRPYIPSTAIKGCLRRVGERHFPDDPGLEILFGSIKNSLSGDSRGQMGLLLVRGAESDGRYPSVAELPYGGKSPSGPGSYVAARTMIDGASGVADDHKLFHQEMLPPGISFTAQLVLLEMGSSYQMAENLFKRLLKLALRDGIQIGKGQADGQGLLSLSSLSLQKLTIDPRGSLVGGSKERLEAAAEEEWRPADVIDAAPFILRCDSPFAVVDSSMKGAGREVAKEAGTVQVSAQRLSNSLPLVLGSSISGALRARADWLYRVDCLRRDIEPLHAGGPVDELFGTQDARALLDIADIRVSDAHEEKITSLKVDRFTGAPVFGALYTTSAFTKTRLSFALRLRRMGDRHPGTEAQALFDALKADIWTNGLQLGHGGNKGFGWFQNEENAHGAR